MKNLIKIAGIVGLLTLASCGENTISKQDLGECLNGNVESCQVEETASVNVTASITKNGNTFEYAGTETGGEMILVKLWEEHRSNTVLNGKVYTVMSRTTFTMNNDGGSILNEKVTIDPATDGIVNVEELSFTETTFEELDSNTMIMDDNGIEVTIEIL